MRDAGDWATTRNRSTVPSWSRGTARGKEALLGRSKEAQLGARGSKSRKRPLPVATNLSEADTRLNCSNEILLNVDSSFACGMWLDGDELALSRGVKADRVSGGAVDGETASEAWARRGGPSIFGRLAAFVPETLGEGSARSSPTVSGDPCGEDGIVLLATHPDSGTTWLKALWEASTGLATESVYVRDSGCSSTIKTCGGQRVCTHKGGGPKGHCLGPRGCGVASFPRLKLVKTHQPNEAIVTRARGVLRTFREPLDQLIAVWRKALREFHWPASACPVAPFFALNARKYARWHCKLTHLLLETGTPQLAIEYAGLTNATHATLKRALEFAGEPADNVDAAVDATPPQKEIPWEPYLRRARWNASTPPPALTHSDAVHLTAADVRAFLDSLEDAIDTECAPLFPGPPPL